MKLDPTRSKHGVLEPTGYCYACGRRLAYSATSSGSLYYCNVECMRRRPPKMVLAEIYWGRPAKEVALESLRAGRSVEAVAEMLGVRKQTLLDWLRRWGIRRRVIWEVAS